MADILSESEGIEHLGRSALENVLFEIRGLKTTRSAYCFAVPWLCVAPSVLGAEPWRKDVDGSRWPA